MTNSIVNGEFASNWIMINTVLGSDGREDDRGRGAMCAL